MKSKAVSPIVKSDCLQPSASALQSAVPVSDVFPLVACLGSSCTRLFTLAAMRSDTLGSACEPLLPLNRWIHCTRTELQSVRADLLHHREEELAVRRLQQSQLDSLQVQIRELAQKQAEFSEQMTEVASHA